MISFCSREKVTFLPELFFRPYLQDGNIADYGFGFTSIDGDAFLISDLNDSLIVFQSFGPQNLMLYKP
jgi:hypothetical protein